MSAKAEQPTPTTFPRHTFALGLATLGALAAGVLFFFDPAKCSFYPPCLWHALTGLACPGCGSTRALHQLLHGHLAAAFHLNPLLVLALPLGFWLLARRFLGSARGKAVSPVLTRQPWPWVLMGVVILFGVARNLPFLPFACLSP